MRAGFPARRVRTQSDQFEKRRGLGRHFSAFALLLALAGLASGCAQMAPHTSHAAAPPQPLARMALPARDADSQAAALVIAAEFALQNDNTAQAAGDYAKAAAISSAPTVAKRAVQLALATHDADQAQAMLARWQALGASPQDLAGARAQLALLEGERAEAEHQFELLLAAGKPDAWKTFAADLLAARDTALAGQVLAAVARPERLPADAALWVALSQVAEHLDRNALARELADTAVRRFGSVDSIRWAAGLRLRADDRAGALALYRNGVAAHPDAVDLRLGYAALLAQKDDDAAALRVLAHGPQTPATWSARVGYAAHAKDATALRQLYAQLQRVPAAEQTRNAFLLGQLAELLQHEQAALAWYAKVDPDADRAFAATVRRAVLLDKLGQADAAHALAAELQHDYTGDVDSLRTAYELDAQLYSQHAEYAQAIAAYNRGLAALPNDPVLTYDRGIEEANAGHTEVALADFRAVLARDPDNVEAMNALGFTLADAKRDLPEATRLLRKALAARPDTAAIMDSWGWLQYRLGHLDQAETYLQRAWGRQQNPDIGVHLGEVLWQLGQHQRARDVFGKVRKLDPGNAALLRAERALRP
jgi:tetratricopeptide (TPR) repeat protein